MMEGELALLKGNARGVDLLEEALKLDPHNPALHYRQGLALLEYAAEEKQERYLHLACKRFKRATELKSDYSEAWQAWGSALESLEDPIQAKEKYSHATPSAELYWDIGRVAYLVGKESGEVSDIKEALDSLEKAGNQQSDLPGEYWIDIGKAYLLMSEKVRDPRLITKSIHAFKQAVSLMLGSSDGWKHLARAIERLYSHTHEEDHFTQASECFAAALHLHPFDGDLWLHWAQFLLVSGRKSRDEKKLGLGIEKCKQALIYLPKNPRVIATWAQLLALIGEITERVDFLYEAENKMNAALDLDEDDPFLCYAFGMCYISFAHYFQDPDYFFQAIEKLQWSLSLDRTLHASWHAMAKCYSASAEIHEDMQYLQTAIRFYAKAEALLPCTTYLVDYAIALTQLGEMKNEPTLFEEAIRRFEWALSQQKNALYAHPEWFFYYAVALDLYANYQDEEGYYLKAIEILSHVIMVEPDFPLLHQRLGLVLSHLAELRESPEGFYRALHHFRLALKSDPENDYVLLDWGVCLLNLSDYLYDTEEKEMVLREAQNKLNAAARLGNEQSYYHLACFHSLFQQYERALYFLDKAGRAQTLPLIEEILDDEWLEGLRMTAPFQEFLTQLEKR